ncbi:MAG: arsenite methyltransferase, partial [Acetobacteraceae bacterium]
MDAMDTDAIKELVRARYGAIAAGCCEPAPAVGCCATGSSADVASARMGYSAAELDAVPEGANLGLGCGNP